MRCGFSSIYRSTALGLFCFAFLMSGPDFTCAKNTQNKSGSFWRKVEDSGIGSFVMPAARNRSDRERIMNVLAYQGVISYDSKGGVIVNRQDKLDAYYKSLQTSGTLKNVYGFSNEEGQDPHGEKSGQFWHNFFHKKEANTKDLPESMDPFANDSMKLATAIHRQLIYATDEASTDYAKTAGDLHVRGIDLLDKDMRSGVAAGAEVYIKALDAMTGGQSARAVEWAEEAAKYAEKVGSDPTQAAKEYLEGKIREKLQNKLTDILKSKMGEDQYDNMMEKYEKYGSEKERAKKMMEDLAKITGDPRLVEAAKQLDNLDPEKLAAKAYENMMAKKAKETEKEKEKKPDSGKPSATGTKKAENDKVENDKVAKSTKIKDASKKTPKAEETPEINPNKITKGYVKGEDGSQVVIIEERDDQGRLVRETYIQTDADGNVISQTDYEGGRGQGIERMPKGDLKGQEGGEGEGDVEIPDQPPVTDDWVQDVEAKSHEAHQAGIKGMQGQLEVSKADAAGEADRAEARATREYGAGRARDTRDQSAADTADAAREQSMGKIMADAVEKAVEQGATATGEAFGSEVGARVAGELFDDDKKEVVVEDEPAAPAAPVVAKVAPKSSGPAVVSTPTAPKTTPVASAKKTPATQAAPASASGNSSSATIHNTPPPETPTPDEDETVASTNAPSGGQPQGDEEYTPGNYYCPQCGEMGYLTHVLTSDEVECGNCGWTGDRSELIYK